jgi:hypothetical protein
VSAFLRAARQLGVPEAALFSKGDLDAPDEEMRPAVLDCLVALQAAAEARDASASASASAAAGGVATPPPAATPLSVQLPASLRRLAVSDNFGAASPLFSSAAGAARTPAASTPLSGTPAPRGEARESLFSLGVNLLRDAHATPTTAVAARARHAPKTPKAHRTSHITQSPLLDPP